MTQLMNDGEYSNEWMAHRLGVYDRPMEESTVERMRCERKIGRRADGVTDGNVDEDGDWDWDEADDVVGVGHRRLRAPSTALQSHHNRHQGGMDRSDEDEDEVAPHVDYSSSA